MRAKAFRSRQVALLALVATLVACAASARQKQLHAAHDALEASWTGLIRWDDAEQTRIVEEAKSLEEGRAALAAHRARRARVVDALTLATDAYNLAVKDPSPALVAEALFLVKRVYDEVRKLGGIP